MNYELPFEKLYVISEWIKKILIINILWILFNLPNLYLLSLLYVVIDINGIISILIVLMISMPFTFFPATTVMFKLVRDLVINKEQQNKIIRSFWKSYKEDYMRNTLGGLLVTLIWVLFIVDYYFFTTYVGGFFNYVFLVLFALLIMYTLNYFSVVVHFQSTLFQVLKNTLLTTIGSPLLTIGSSILNIGLIYVSFNYITFLIPLFLGSTVALISFASIHHFFLKVESFEK